MAQQVIGKVSIMPCGEYQSNTRYSRLSLVSYQGSSYIAISDNENVPVTNSSVWYLVAAKGDTGEQGIQGVKGDKGDKGDTYQVTQADLEAIANQITSDASSAFNQNVAQKTEDFNDNYTEKLNSFNDNAESYDNRITNLETTVGSGTDTFSTSSTYAVGDIVVKDNKFYRCTTAITTPGEWNSSKWELISVRTEQDEQNNRLNEQEQEINKVDVKADLLINSHIKSSSYASDSLQILDASNLPINNIKIGENSYIQQINYKGKNKVGFPNKDESTIIDVTVSAQDGIISLNGQANTDIGTTLVSTTLFSLAAGTYTINIIPVSGTWSAGSLGLRGFNSSNSQVFAKAISYTNKSASITLTQEEAESLRTLAIYSRFSPTFSDFKFEIQLVEGLAEDLDYEPYVGGVPSPSPDYPQNIDLVSGTNKIYVHNKNLLNYRDNMPNEYESYGITYTVNSDGSIHCEGTATGYSQLYLNTITLKEGQYTRSFKDNNNETVKFQVRKNSSAGGDIFNGDYTYYGVRTTTLRTNILAYCRLVVSEGTTVNETVYPMIETGLTAPSYVKGLCQTYMVTLPTGMFLGKLDNSENYIYGEKDNWILHKGLAKRVLDGTESGWYYTNSVFYLQNYLHTLRGSGKSVVSNKFMGSTNTDTITNAYAKGNNIICGSIFANTDRIYIRYDGATSLSDFKTWLDTNKPEIYYSTETIEEVAITDESLIAQLNTIIDNMHTYTGQTVIFTQQETGVAPAVRVVYYEDDDFLINDNARKIAMLKDNYDVKTLTSSNNADIIDCVNYLNDGNIKIGDNTLEQTTLTGKNLWGGYTENSHTLSSGPTVTYKTNGTIILDGTATSSGNTATSSYATTNGLYVSIPAGSYFVSGGKAYAKRLEIYNLDAITSLGIDSGNGVAFTLEETTNVMVRVAFSTGEEFSNEIFYVQIEAGDAATDFEEYCGATPSPNPDYPQDIKIVEGNCKLEAHTKNLIENKVGSWVSNSVTITRYEDGSISAVGTNTGKTINFITQTNIILPAGSYKFSIQEALSESIKMELCYVDNSRYYSVISAGNTQSNPTLTKDVIWYRMYNDAYEAGHEFNITFKPQLEKGSSVTSFVVGKAQSYPITLPENIFLCSFGNESNYIYGTKNNWWVHEGIGKLVLNGNEAWIASSLNPNSYGLDAFQYNHNLGSNYAVNNAYCNYFLNSSTLFVNTQVESMMWQNKAVYLRVKHDVFESSVADFKEWLANHLPVIYYKKSPSSSEVSITDAVLGQQLNDIADNLQTYRGETLIFTAGDDLAPNIQFNYLKNPLAALEARVALLES